jgi:hypothetical protein
MSNLISTSHNKVDGWGVQEKGASLILGKLIKFSEGQYTVDKTEPLVPGSRFIANDVVTCWVFWDNGRPREHRVTQPGGYHPDRSEFGQLDKEEWPIGPGGEPSDPIRDTRYVHLIDQKTGQNYTFITDSFGGLRAVGDLKAAIMNVRTQQPTARPIIELGAVRWKTKHGQKLRPDFEIKGWLGGTDYKSNAPIQPLLSGPSEAYPDGDDELYK